jgi:hypothetical protein
VLVDQKRDAMCAFYRLLICLFSRSRLAFFCFGMLFFLGLLGCRDLKKAQPEAPSSLHAPPSVEMIRGMRSGMSVKALWAQLCRVWLLGRCKPLERQYERHDQPWPQIYLYEDKDGAYPCLHRFYFAQWGLDSFITTCTLHTHAQREALLRRYHRWLGQPAFLHTAKGIYLWSSRERGIEIRLRLKKRLVLATHQDLRMRWRLMTPFLEPKATKPDDKEAYQRWQAIPTMLREEALRNLGQIIYLWDRAYKARWRSLSLDNTPWTQSNEQGCKATPPNPNAWSAPTWQSLHYLPDLPTRLRYRFRWKEKQSQRENRFFPSPRVPFVLEAKGCGYRFLVEGEQLDGGFEKTQGISVKPIFVSPAQK